MALGKNLKKAREAKGLSQEALSALTNGVVSQGAIAALEGRDSKSSQFTTVLAKALDVGERELMDGVRSVNTSKSDFVITQYDAGGSMGTGRLVLEDGQPGIIKSWRVDHEWLRLNVRHYTKPENLCIVTGFGPSMRPRYNPGDPLLIDSGITAVESDGVYFFRVGEHGYIKQLQRIPGEKGTVFRAKSYNPDYEPFDITKKMDFEVFGKILTIWKSEQL